MRLGLPSQDPRRFNSSRGPPALGDRIFDFAGLMGGPANSYVVFYLIATLGVADQHTGNTGPCY